MPDQLFTKIQLTDESIAWYKHGIYPVIGTQTGTKSGAWTGNIDVPELYDGLTIAYFLPIAGNGNATLKLTLSTGEETAAIPVYVTGTTQATTHYAAGSTIILTYWSAGAIKISGTTTTTARWSHADYYIQNTNTSYTLYHQSSTWKAYTILYRYQLLLQKNETSLLPINTTSNSTATTKTLTTESFNPFGVIRYYNTTTTVQANANIAAIQLYEQQSINLGYSFNTGSTLTSGQDVYIVAVPQSDGMAKLDSNPISQTLPTTEDGKIYIYLGHAYSTSNIELYPVHPIYQFKNGRLCFYTGNEGNQIDNATYYLGIADVPVSGTPIEDGGNCDDIIINNETWTYSSSEYSKTNKTYSAGAIISYYIEGLTKEFICDVNGKWQEFGDIDGRSLKSFAYVSEGTANYIPSGNVTGTFSSTISLASESIDVMQQNGAAATSQIKPSGTISIDPVTIPAQNATVTLTTSDVTPTFTGNDCNIEISNNASLNCAVQFAVDDNNGTLPIVSSATFNGTTVSLGSYVTIPTPTGINSFTFEDATAGITRPSEDVGGWLQSGGYNAIPIVNKINYVDIKTNQASVYAFNNAYEVLTGQPSLSKQTSNGVTSYSLATYSYSNEKLIIGYSTVQGTQSFLTSSTSIVPGSTQTAQKYDVTTGISEANVYVNQGEYTVNIPKNNFINGITYSKPNGITGFTGSDVDYSFNINYTPNGSISLESRKHSGTITIPAGSLTASYVYTPSGTIGRIDIPNGGTAAVTSQTVTPTGTFTGSSTHLVVNAYSGGNINVNGDISATFSGTSSTITVSPKSE